MHFYKNIMPSQHGSNISTLGHDYKVVLTAIIAGNFAVTLLDGIVVT
jgi:hypothetical protein